MYVTIRLKSLRSNLAKCSISVDSLMPPCTMNILVLFVFTIVANGKCVNKLVAALNIAEAYLPYLP